jgi:hypothetical protein
MGPVQKNQSTSGWIGSKLTWPGLLSRKFQIVSFPSMRLYGICIAGVIGWLLRSRVVS